MTLQDFETISLVIAGPLARLTLNRPEQRNGMTNRMVREVHLALSQVAVNENIRILVLTGAGTAFCPGADLNSIGAPSDDPMDSTEQKHFQVPALLHSMPALTIAAINGACAGAGFGWACGCDIRVASQSAMLNTAFLNVAVAGDMGVPWSLPRLVGASKARELSFFSEKFTASEAAAMGLVARVFSDETFSDDVESMTATFLARSPTALVAMKSHYLAAEAMTFPTFVELETERHKRIASGSHAREAFKAFIEKRPPKFDE